jgi:hypothetical protein
MSKGIRRKEFPKQALLRKLFNYDPETGIVVRRINYNRTKAGDIVGFPFGSRGHLGVKINRLSYFLHIVIWIYVMGDESIPNGIQLDHINIIPIDNRWKNLRLATPAQNIANTNKRITNKVGYKGVYFEKSTNKYIAEICVKGKRIKIGRFKILEEAARAYDRAAIKYHGEFARINFPRENYE